jgi:signal transduction histidine kinase
MSIRESPPNEELLVAAVQDTGPGIPTADLPTLFDDPRNPGLSLAQDIAKTMRGLITVTTTPEGTTFTATVPLFP